MSMTLVFLVYGLACIALGALSAWPFAYRRGLIEGLSESLERLRREVS